MRQASVRPAGFPDAANFAVIAKVDRNGLRALAGDVNTPIADVVDGRLR